MKERANMKWKAGSLVLLGSMARHSVLRTINVGVRGWLKHVSGVSFRECHIRSTRSYFLASAL